MRAILLSACTVLCLFLAATAVAAPKKRPAGQPAGLADAQGNASSGGAMMPSVVPQGEARPASEFCDSVGVCAHLGRTNTNYVQKFDELEKLFVESGIRHVRTDGVMAKEAVNNVLDMAKKGFKFDMIVHGSGDVKGVKPQVDNIKRNFANCVEFIEGPNEPDHNPENAIEWMKEIYRMVKADPVLKNVAVMGCAPAFVERVNTKFGDCSAFVDVGNIHAYPGGRAPEISVRGYVDPSKVMYPNKPLYITETGYHNALNNPPNKHRPTPDEVAAVYMPRLYLDYFRIGIPCSYKYQFLDDRTEEEALNKYHQPVQEANFGLVNYHLKPKKAFFAIKNLLTILKDEPSPGFKAGKLDYAVSGDKEEMRSLLLAKGNGKYYLAVWRAVPIWDPNKRVEIPIDTKQVTVDLKQPAKLVTLYKPTQSAEAKDSLKNVSKIPLSLDGEAVILEIEPAAK